MGCREDCGDEVRCGGCPRGTDAKLPQTSDKTDFNSFTDSRLKSNSLADERVSTNNPIENGGPFQTEESRVKSWSYRGNNVDLTKFLRFHPGGTVPLKALKGKELEPSMNATGHSSEAYYLLRDFYNGNPNEDIVDWSKAMLGQVGRLGPLYECWVWSPVDRPLRLFRNDWLEKLTRTNWQQVVSVWSTVISISLLLSYSHSPVHLPIYGKILAVLLTVVCGMAVWPLLEYSIHRWLFHLQPPKNSSLLITLHFGLHGLHHKVPFDEGRLLFPPGPCSFMALSIYYIYTSLFPWWIAMALFSGTMLGYLIYDLIHYYLHHGNPKEGTYLYHMKRYHNQHHFAQQEKGFGISSDFWDHAFDTLIKLKKLSKSLTWDT